MSYDLREHTADVAVEATGPTLGSAFAQAAEGLTTAHCESIPDDIGERFPVVAHAESKEALLFEYLDELIYQRDVRGVLPADHEVRVHWNGEWVLEGSARGVPFEAVDAREIKAVTYSEMEIDERVDDWWVYVVFDV
jgi:SHS2 domain-containing protein